jgi:pyruvate kinase
VRATARRRCLPPSRRGLSHHRARRWRTRATGVLLDTKGPEIRSGFFAGGLKKIDLVKGASLTLTADYNFKGSAKKLGCSYPQLATSVKTGQSILCADGSLVLTVLSCHPSEGEVVCRIENDCSIGERKNMVSTSSSA